MRWLVLVALLVGSSTEARSESLAPSDPMLSTAARPPVESVWAGTYVCAQGLTAVTLVLDHEGDALRGTFEFGALPQNPNVPHGKYTVVGSSAVQGDDVAIALRPGEWIERPRNYVMVGVSARIDRDRRVLSGTITYPSCSAIQLHRVR